MTIISWNDIKLREDNGCLTLSIFIHGKTCAFGHRHHRFGRNSVKYLMALHLKCAFWKIFVSYITL